MPRKQHKHHFIYKTVCLITKKYYIGMHSTSNLKDGYLGSGKRLWHSINYHGRENHIFKILEFCLDRKQLFTREREIVNKSLLLDPLCMNLREGGEGWNGFTSSAHQLKCSTAGGKSFSNRLKSDPEFKEKFSNMISESNRSLKRGLIKKQYNWTGKSHSAKTKEKIGVKNAVSQLGEKNSQFGTCWITKDLINKKVKKEDLNHYLKDGWIKGRLKITRKE